MHLIKEMHGCSLEHFNVTHCLRFALATHKATGEYFNTVCLRDTLRACSSF